MNLESHWIYRNEPLNEVPSNAFGFVYLITSKIDNKKYVGRKYLTKAKTTSKRVSLKSGIKVTKKKKSRVESDWRVYTGSCKPLNESIERLGKENFTFEILCFCETKGQTNFAECWIQMKLNVIIDETFYNDAIGSGQFRGVKFSQSFKNILREIKI